MTRKSNSLASVSVPIARCLRFLATCGAVLAALCVARADDPPTGQPLECMQRFNLKQYPVVAWCFHTYGGTDYNEQYARDLAGAGFNTAVETGFMLDAMHKAGVKLIYNMEIEDTLTENEVWGEKRTHPNRVGWPNLEAFQKVHEKHGKHPALAGYLVNGNYGPQFPAKAAECAKWLEGQKTGLLPWVVECRDVEGQAKAGFPVVSLECFTRKTHKAFGYDNKGWAHEKRNGYCVYLERGRQIANKHNMAFWPLYSALTATKGRGEGPVGNLHGESEIRFQILAPVAYGAQGVVSFVYSTDRAVWKPADGPTYRAAREANTYLAQVAGPRVLGHRSMGVYHSTPITPVPKPKVADGALVPGEGKLIEKMDPGVMAGVLVSEKDFRSGANTPAYVMLIDARTEVLSDEQKLTERTLKVTFGPQVQGVEILGAKGEPALRQSGRELSLTLRPGDGRLLRIVSAPAKSS